MKLTWHLVQKDLVRLRLAVLLWVLLLALASFFHLRLFSLASVDAAWFDRAGLFASVFALMPLLVGYFLAASLVLEDPPAGAQAFWATRPISGGRLLAAKTLGLLLVLGVIPIVVRLPEWLYYGLNAADLGKSALRNLTVMGIVTTPAVVLSALTGQSGRFLLSSLLLLLALPTATVWLASRSGSQLDPQLTATRFLVAALLAGTGGLAAAVALYLTRQMVCAVVMFVVGALAAVACLLAWPWRMDQLLPQTRSQLAGTGAIAADIVEASLSPAKNTASPANTLLILTLRLNGVPDDRMLLSAVADVELRWPDGSVFRSEHQRLSLIPGNESPLLRPLFALPPYRPDPASEQKWGELRAERLRQHPPSTATASRRRAPLAPGVPGAFLSFGVPPEIAARIRAQPPACTVSARLKVGVPIVSLELPLRSGTSQAGDGTRLRILDVAEDPRPVGEREEKVPDHWTISVVSGSALGIKPIIYRVDRQRGVFERLQSNFSSRPAFPAGTNVERATFALVLPRVWRNDTWVNEPNWFSAQRLVALTHREVGGFNRTFRTDRLPLQQELPR